MPAVAVASYGDKYLPMLLSFLESWGSRFPRVFLALGEVSDGVAEDLGAAFPGVEVLQVTNSFSKKEDVRISQKMRLWLTLAEHAGIRESDFVVFADADTVLVRDIPDFCQGDVVVTLRSPRSSFLLNSGVVGLSSKAIASGFVKEWAARNEVIISDPQRLAAAVSPHGIYGGGDQMALIEMLGLDDPAQRAAYGQLSIRTVPCRQFNACENAIDLDEVRVVHQKAALHKFLLERRPLIGPRKMQDSIFQLRAAIDANQAAIQRMKNNGVCGARIDELYRFRLPRGVKGDLSVPFPVLAAHKAVAAARRMGGRLLRQLKLR